MSKAYAGGWSRVAKLISGTNTAATGSLQQAFDKAEAYTCTFTLKVDDDLNQVSGFPPHSVAPIQAEATIEFTVAGNTYTRVLSVTDGMSVTGVCNAIRVRVVDTTTPVGLADIVGLQYHISIQVAPGIRDRKSVV